MTADEMLALKSQEPFRPFRLYIDDGSAYDIVRPGMVMVTDLRLVIAIPDPKDPESEIYDHFERANWEHIIRVEHLGSRATA